MLATYNRRKTLSRRDYYRFPPGAYPMTSNPRFAQYVERVQEYLALFSITDDQAETFLRKSDSISNYQPKFLVFEILFNHQPNEEFPPVRKFDPHVSTKLLEGLTIESALEDLERLYANADILRRRGNSLDWQMVDWQTPEDEKFSVLAEEMRILDQIHDRVFGEHQHEQNLDELEQRVRHTHYEISDQDRETIRRILNKLVLRYEVEYIPTSLASTGLIYEAWKRGNLQPLGNPEDDAIKFGDLLNALFVYVEAGYQGSPLVEMARKMGLGDLSELGVSRLSNGEVWASVHQPWFTCVEQSLIHKTLIRDVQPDTYTIHFPLIIDNYWFAGFCYLYTTVEDDAQKQMLPEVFIRSKFAKFYYAVQSVSETLRFSLRADALRKVELLFESGIEDPDVIFSEVVKNYFVCFDIVKSSEVSVAINCDPLNTKLLYAAHDIEIYGPTWISEIHMQLLSQEIDGANQQLGFYRVPGLYEDVVDRIERLKQGLERGREDQAGVFSHQAAGLVAEVWCDPAMNRLAQQTQGSLWQLKTLIDIWGNFDLEPDVPLNQGPEDFPETWANLSSRELLNQLIDISVVHALRRATYRRAGGTAADQVTRAKALEIRKSPNRIALFKEWVKLEIREEIDGSTYPDWLNYRGFVLCFHHCFWQAAFHGFRARCNLANTNQTCLVGIKIDLASVTIFNRKGNLATGGYSSRDGNFYQENLVDRVRGYFQIDGPKPSADSDDIWEVIITHSRSKEIYGNS